MPLFKFGTLLIRTLSKPVANVLKARAVKHESFRKLCAGFAQWWHKMEVTLQVQLMGHTARTIKPLDEATAVKTGAEVFGEGIVFSIAATILLVENRRAAASEARKNAKIEERFEEQGARLEELERAFSILRQDTLDMMRRGGKYSTHEIFSRASAETRRVMELEDLKQEKPESSFMDTLKSWTGYGFKVFNGDIPVTDAASEAVKSTFVAVTPSMVSNYVLGDTNTEPKKRA